MAVTTGISPTLSGYGSTGREDDKTPYILIIPDDALNHLMTYVTKTNDFLSFSIANKHILTIANQFLKSEEIPGSLRYILPVRELTADTEFMECSRELVIAVAKRNLEKNEMGFSSMFLPSNQPTNGMLAEKGLTYSGDANKQTKNELKEFCAIFKSRFFKTDLPEEITKTALYLHVVPRVLNNFTLSDMCTGFKLGNECNRFLEKLQKMVFKDYANQPPKLITEKSFCETKNKIETLFNTPYSSALNWDLNVRLKVGKIHGVYFENLSRVLADTANNPVVKQYQMDIEIQRKSAISAKQEIRSAQAEVASAHDNLMQALGINMGDQGFLNFLEPVDSDDPEVGEAKTNYLAQSEKLKVAQSKYDVAVDTCDRMTLALQKTKDELVKKAEFYSHFVRHDDIDDDIEYQYIDGILRPLHNSY